MVTVAMLSITASPWGKPQVLAFRDGYLLETLDEMPTPPARKDKMTQSSEKCEGEFLLNLNFLRSCKP